MSKWKIGALLALVFVAGGVVGGLIGSAGHVHGIHMGDFPTWIALVIAGFGGSIALIQLRQQFNVLKGEVERNKCRDELLNGQLKDLKERLEDRVREQAEHVSVEWGAPPREAETTGKVINKSRRPITKISARVTAPLPDGRPDIDYGSAWTFFFDWEDEDNSVPADSGALTALRPKAMGVCSFSQYGNREHARLVVRFYDDAGRRWQLDHYMHLEPAPDDGW